MYLSIVQGERGREKKREKEMEGERKSASEKKK